MDDRYEMVGGRCCQGCSSDASTPTGPRRGTRRSSALVTSSSDRLHGYLFIWSSSVPHPHVVRRSVPHRELTHSRLTRYVHAGSSV